MSSEEKIQSPGGLKGGTRSIISEKKGPKKQKVSFLRAGGEKKGGWCFSKSEKKRFFGRNFGKKRL